MSEERGVQNGAKQPENTHAERENREKPLLSEE